MLDSDAFQLKRMMRQDAHEKAFEMQVLGQRAYEEQRDKTIAEGERKLKREFESKLDDQRIKQKIEVSQLTNQTRLDKMKHRNECMENLRSSAMERLCNDYGAGNEQYIETLKNLIVQGMIKLLEEEVELKVREDEVDVVKGLIEECEAKYAEIMLEETTREYSTKLSVMEDLFLRDDEGGKSGGVLLYAHNRKIVVSNTLEDRLNLVFEGELPQLRAGLFPKNPRESGAQ